MRVKIFDRQSLVDLALQTGGALEAVVALAVNNDLCITDCIESGTEIETTAPINKMITTQYTTKKIRPATALAQSGEGIGMQRIGNFKIK